MAWWRGGKQRGRGAPNGTYGRVDNLNFGGPSLLGRWDDSTLPCKVRVLMSGSQRGGMPPPYAPPPGFARYLGKHDAVTAITTSIPGSDCAPGLTTTSISMSVKSSRRLIR